MNLNLAYTEFVVPIAVSEKSALGKRGFKGGLKVELEKIPANVLTELLVAAVHDFVKAKLPKAADAPTTTREECIAAMQGQLDLLQSGAMSAKTARKAPSRNPVNDLAKKLVKTTINNGSEVDIPAKKLNADVNAMFKRYKAWQSPKVNHDEKAAFATTAKFIEAHIDAAKKQLAAQQALQASLAGFVNAGSAPAEAAPVAATPTAKVKKAKAAASAPAR